MIFFLIQWFFWYIWYWSDQISANLIRSVDEIKSASLAKNHQFLRSIFYHKDILLKFLILIISTDMIKSVADESQSQLMELKVSWWSWVSADSAQCQVMEIKVSWWSSKSVDGALIQLMEVMVSNGAQVQQLIWSNQLI